MGKGGGGSSATAATPTPTRAAGGGSSGGGGGSHHAPTSYTEYTLLSSGGGHGAGGGLSHHIMKLTMSGSRLALYERALEDAAPGTPPVLFLPPVTLKRAAPPPRMAREPGSGPSRWGRKGVASSSTSAAAAAVGGGAGGGSRLEADPNVAPAPTLASGYDASQVAPTSKVDKGAMFKKKNKSFFFGREDLADMVPVNQKNIRFRQTTTTTVTSAGVVMGVSGRRDHVGGASTSIAAAAAAAASATGSTSTIVTTTRFLDPDRHPWVLEEGGVGTAEHFVYHGHKEQEGTGSHVLFVMADASSFKVIPASKTYKFTMRPAYKTLTAEEAEAAMAARNHMWNGIEGGLGAEEGGTGPNGVPIRSWERIGTTLQSKAGASSGTAATSSKPARRRAHEEMEDFDFDQVVSDDEEVDFGMDDADEAKEASSRMYGKYANKAGFEGEFEEAGEPLPREPTSGLTSKRLAKTLFKAEKNEAYLAVEEEEENPYLSDDSAEGYEEEEGQQQRGATGLLGPGEAAAGKAEAATRQTGVAWAAKSIKAVAGAGKPTSGTSSRAGSPPSTAFIQREPRREQSPLLETTSIASGGRASRLATPSTAGSDKRKRASDSVSPQSAAQKIKSEPGHTPAPPSAAEVLAKERERKRRMKLAATQQPPPAGSNMSEAYSSVVGSVSPAPMVRAARAGSPAAPSVLSSQDSQGRRGAGAAGSGLVDGAPGSTPEDANLLTEEDIIQVIRSASGPLSVKDIVSALKRKLQADPRNKERMKQLFKRVAKNEEGGVTLKDEYLCVVPSIVRGLGAALVRLVGSGAWWEEEEQPTTMVDAPCGTSSRDRVAYSSRTTALPTHMPPSPAQVYPAAIPSSSPVANSPAQMAENGGPEERSSSPDGGQSTAATHDVQVSYLSTRSVVTVEPSKAVQKLSWHNVEYAVPLPGAKEKGRLKRLLLNIHGEVNAGEVVAIMGGSGAGKTTLLNTLAGRIGPAGMLTGDILVDGAPRRHAIWRNQCAYVEQDDLLYPNLSVYETIKFAALLRLPSSMSTEIKLQRVDEVIMELGLNGCRHTRIGGPTQRGISGGERKRVSIAIELVAQPSILFLDEPTSGLDAFTAVNIIDTIKKLAVSQKKIVLMTIHQPRTDILEMFDKIALLSVGRIAFFGPLEEALTHFAALGFPLPPKTNPSDFFMDIGTLDQRSDTLREKSMQRIKLFHDAWEGKLMQALEGKAAAPAQAIMQAKQRSQWPSPWTFEFGVLLQRNIINVLRDKASLGANIGQALFLVIVLGFTYFRSGLDQAGLQNRIGICFFLCVNLTFGNIMPMISVFPLEKAIVKHERASGAYRPSSAFLSKLTSTLPLLWISMVLLCAPLYWMVGFQDDAGKFFIYLLILFVHVNVANALGFFISSAIPTVVVGQVVGPMVLVIFLLFGGQLVNLDSVTWAYRWLQYISLIAYTNKALAQNEFTGLTFSCPAGKQCLRTGTAVLSVFKLDNLAMWTCVGFNAALCVALFAGAFVLYKYTSKPQLRLV